MSIIRTRCASFQVDVIHEEIITTKTLLERSLCSAVSLSRRRDARFRKTECWPSIALEHLGHGTSQSEGAYRGSDPADDGVPFGFEKKAEVQAGQEATARPRS